MAVWAISVIEEEGSDVIVLTAVVPAAGLMLLLGMDRLEARLFPPDPTGRRTPTTPPNHEPPGPNPPIIRRTTTADTQLPHIGDDATRRQISETRPRVVPRECDYYRSSETGG